VQPAASPLAAGTGVKDVRSARITLASFFVSVLLGGGNGIAIRFSNRELPPLWGATLRFCLTAALFIVVMVLLRLSLPRGRALLGAILYGTLNFGVSSAFAYYALVRLHAGLGQTLVAVIPLMTLLLAAFYGQERLRLSAMIGTALALLGIGVVSGASFGEPVPLLSVVAALGAALAFSQSIIIVRGFPPVHPVTMNAVGATAGGAFLLTGTLLSRESLLLPQHLTTWLALAYVVPFGTVLVFGLYLVVLRYWTASRAAYAFVLIPIVTIVLSAWLDHERIGVSLLFGALLVIAGVYVGALRRPV
jgi:drug/metabolite transporter (DMT)-like permease